MCDIPRILLLFLTGCFVAIESYTRESLEESQVLARLKRQNGGIGGPAGECVLPPVPSNGKWEEVLLVTTREAGTWPTQPGQTVSRDTVLRYKCNKQYSLSPNISTTYCNDNGWSHQPPQCLKTCPPLGTRESMTVKCTRNNIPITCETPYYEGTRVEFGCISLHENGEDFSRYLLKHCQDGSWNSTFLKCEPVGGLVNMAAEPTMGIGAGGCVLPPFQFNGYWEVFVPGQSYHPGQSVAKGIILQYKCNTSHALYPNNPTAFCNDKGWSIPQPECLKTCPPIKISDRMTATCTYNDLAIDCQTPYKGTQAEVECTSLYEAGEFIKRPYRFCQDGSWEPPLPQCEPICGLKSTEAKLQVIGGDNTKRGEYPWMVGIYIDHNKQHICGGSIITPKITLTVAHCFGESQDPNYYMLAAGKYHREYSDPNDKDAVFSKIKKLMIHDLFRNGENMFAYDIAILVVETQFKPSRFIMPVCIDYDSRFEEASLVNSKGLVTGWGFTTSVDSPSDVLKVLEVNFLSESTCPLPEDIHRFYRFARDKMCAGSTNKGESSCQGDSGGPLMFKRDQRYFIRGIVSLGAKDKRTYGCDSNKVTLFTSVHYHVKWIQRYVTQYRDTD